MVDRDSLLLSIRDRVQCPLRAQAGAINSPKTYSDSELAFSLMIPLRRSAVPPPEPQPLSRCRKLLTMAATRTDRLGPAARPVAVPDDIERAPKANGVVELPRRVRWSGPPKVYDLSEHGDRLRVYEQVLREGTEDDVRHYIDPDTLLDLWDELVLPAHVRAAWAAWFRQHRSIDPSC